MKTTHLLRIVYLLLAVFFSGIAHASEEIFEPSKVFVASGLRTFQFDFLTVAQTSSGLTLTWHDGQKQSTWVIDINSYMEQIPCTYTDACDSRASVNCYAGCIIEPPAPKIFDKKNKKLYFFLIGDEHLLVLFAANLKERTLTRILVDSTFGEPPSLKLSPQRRYLAYTSGHHGSACEDFLTLRIHDVVKNYDVSGSSRDPWKTYGATGIITSIEPIMWMSENKLKIRKRNWRCASAAHTPTEGKTLIEIIKIPDIITR
jgi:hypothetical protein